MKSLRLKIFSKLVWVFIIFLIAIFVYRNFIYFPVAIEKTGPNSLSIDFAVERGEPVRNISARLEEIGIVADSWVLLKYLAKNDLDRQVEAGHFNFRGGENVPEVAEILLAGQAKQVTLTILEGWNSFKIDEKLVEMELIESGEFELFVREGGSTTGNDKGIFADRPVASLEGYLFPATYKIDPENFSIENLIERMLNAMENSLNELGFNSQNSDRTLHEILTLASIIELEENSEKNRAKVADILWRRLDSGMGLYADSTLFYILGHREKLLTADFEIDSPYNTRKYRDLPPTPVCAPSRNSIFATLNPEPNKFYYYLHDADGKIHFGQTLDEHNANKTEFN